MSLGLEPGVEPVERWVGQDLDWNAKSVPVTLFVELPFWLMMPNATFDIEVNAHVFSVEVREDFHEIFVVEAADSRKTCIHIGPADDDEIDPEVRRQVEESKARFITRKCKTVLKIYSRCNVFVLAAEATDGPLAGQALLYLRAFCSAHLEVVNRLVQSYRLATYDFFPHEVSPWDIPNWIVKCRRPAALVTLLPYATWDDKPHLGPLNQPDVSEPYQLIAPQDLATRLHESPSPGEFDLLDAINLMERGDYSGAVRRIATAIEVLVEEVLRTEFRKQELTDQQIQDNLFRIPEVDRRMKKYAAMTKRDIPDALLEDWKRTRELRRRIVHDGHRVVYQERGYAQRAVDTGRWLYNWFENRPDRYSVREQRIGTRSIGRHMAWNIFSAEVTPAGVEVHPPFFAVADREAEEFGDTTGRGRPLLQGPTSTGWTEVPTRKCSSVRRLLRPRVPAPSRPPPGRTPRGRGGRRCRPWYSAGYGPELPAWRHHISEPTIQEGADRAATAGVTATNGCRPALTSTIGSLSRVGVADGRRHRSPSSPSPPDQF